ncbi:MAG: sugar transferase [Bacteroidetes bacterium]|nr:sugar transferase [Bacteroidota bacterium]
MAYPLKRPLDLALTLAAAPLLLPIGLGVALLVRRKLGSPVLFRQTRPGLHGRPFTMLKFRTMTDARSADGLLLSDAERLTPLGRFLRATSLDELPGLINVLKGEMSLVGPRPLLVQYLDRYTPEQARRHEALPGLTGWAQVNGRQDIPFSHRLELDLEYVKRQSIGFDLKILALTLPKVFGAAGVRSGQNVREVDDLGLHQDPS